MGVLLGLALRRRWLMLGSILLAFVAAFLPPRPVRDVLLATAVAGMVVALVVGALQVLHGRSGSN